MAKIHIQNFFVITLYVLKGHSFSHIVDPIVIQMLSNFVGKLNTDFHVGRNGVI